MTTKTNLKAGRAASGFNHNETMRGLAVRTQVRVGRAGYGGVSNHNETLGGIKLNTQVKAGKLAVNHNESLRSTAMTIQTNVNETTKVMKVRTQVRAGRKIDGSVRQHNETLRGLVTKTRVKAGQKVR